MTPETSIKRQVKDYLKIRGWFCYSNMAGLGSFPGLSDLVAVKDGVVLWIEVKAPSGRMSEHQHRFKDNIESHGGHYVLAYGHEEIERHLHSIGKSELCLQENLF